MKSVTLRSSSLTAPRSALNTLRDIGGNRRRGGDGRGGSDRRCPQRQSEDRAGSSEGDGDADGASCWLATTREVAQLLARKWLVFILRRLSTGPQRNFQLRQTIDGISPKMLSETLHCLTRDGLIKRILIEDDLGQVAIAFEITELGASLLELLDVLKDWGDAHLDQVLDHRAAAERTSA